MLDILYYALSAIALVLYVWATLFASRHFIHMFQLNSYKPNVQKKWLKDNEKKYFLTALICAVLVLIPLVLLRALLQLNYSDTVSYIWTIYAFRVVPIITAVLSICVIIAKRPKKAYKTPLVYTARVKRLIATLTALHILLFAIAAIIGLSSAYGLIGVWILFLGLPSVMILLLPYTVLFANLLNRPIEKAINRYYINDAKKILESCRPHLKVIGITGSFGKTSVKYFLDELLSVKYNVLKTPGNFNTPLGVVKTIRGSLRATHDIFLCEMGAKNVGDIKEICDIVHPDMGVITSIGPMHIESFKSIENVIKTKFELADAVAEKDGMIFANFDNEYIASECTHRNAVPYGIEIQDGYSVSELSISERGSEFDITAPNGESEHYYTELIGRHNVINIAGAIAVANSMGIGLKELKPAVRKLESVPHRLQLIDKGSYTVIDDAYNSNPSGTKAALETLSMTNGMKILVTPGMIELGDMQYKLNYEFGENAASVCDFIALVGKKQTEPIYQGLIASGYDSEKIYIAESLNDAMTKVYGLTSEGKRKIILLENDLPDNY